MESKVTNSEWLWVVIASLLIMVILSLPYVIGTMRSTPDMQFGGFLFGVEDANSYIAKMRYGVEDGWLFRLMYTSEPHEGGFVYTFYLGLGKLAALISGEGKGVETQTLIEAYHIARVTLGIHLLLTTYGFISQFLSSAPQRRLAWSLASVGGGLGWLGLFIGGRIGQPLEFYVPEAFGLLLPYGLPHLALARSMMMIGWMLLIRAARSGRHLDGAYASVAWLIMSIIVPFDAALVAVLMTTWLIGLWLQQRQFPLRAFHMCVLSGSLPLIVLIYDGWLFSTNPVFAAWARQNQLASPSFLDFALAYGVAVILGIIAIMTSGYRDRDDYAVLLLTWPPTALLLANLPINVQRRLLEAVFVLLSILAVQGLWRIVGERPDADAPTASWRLRQVAMGVALMMLFPSTILLIGGGIVTANQPGWPNFHSASELAALNWLGANAPFGSLVLSSRDAGNVLPAYAPVRVYVGHGPETIDSEQKAAVIDAFFSATMSDSDRLTLIEEVQAQYLWVGPEEKGEQCGADGCLDESALHLIPRFRNADYIVYEVQEP